MGISNWLCTILSIPFTIGLLSVCRHFKLNKMPIVGIIGFSIMFAWVGMYHSGNPMHGKSGPILLFLLIGPLQSFVLWKSDELKKLRMLSLLSFIIMLFILLRAIPSETIRSNFTGLIQRFVYFAWSIWFVSLSLIFFSLLNKRNGYTRVTKKTSRI